MDQVNFSALESSDFSQAAAHRFVSEAYGEPRQESKRLNVSAEQENRYIESPDEILRLDDVRARKILDGMAERHSEYLNAAELRRLKQLQHSLLEGDAAGFADGMRSLRDDGLNEEIVTNALIQNVESLGDPIDGIPRIGALRAPDSLMISTFDRMQVGDDEIVDVNVLEYTWDGITRGSRGVVVLGRGIADAHRVPAEEAAQEIGNVMRTALSARP